MKPAPLRKVPAYLRFEDGRCTGLVTPNEQSFTVADLVNHDLLSITDRMILDQIAARVDKLTRQLASAGENRG